MGFLEGFPHCQTIRFDAQESSVHPILRSRGTQQMGLSLRSIPGYGLLLHHANVRIYLGQSHLHSFRSEEWNCAGDRIGNHRSWVPDWRQYPSTLDGQENERV